MKRFINFGSISQFRQIVKDVQFSAQYLGYDEDKKEVILDRTAKMPVITLTGSEKVHGSNAAICYSHPDGMWVQSRKNIITPEKDNAGCAFAAEANSIEWMDIILALATEYGINLDENIISIYYEWCGGNIQKNACVSGLDKMAIIFQHFKVSPIEPQIADDSQEKVSYWLETKIKTNDNSSFKYIDEWVENREKNIHNVMDFPTISLEVNFERPDLAQNEMIKLTEEVEKNSGIAKAFDKPDNIGEGYVWTFNYKNNIHRFKTKGEKHSNSKVKTLKPVDNEKEQKKIDMANQVTPGWRLEQMYNETFDTINGGTGDINRTEEFLKAVKKDIIKEESDVIAEAGLEPKEIFGKVSKISRTWFLEQLDREAGI